MADNIMELEKGLRFYSLYKIKVNDRVEDKTFEYFVVSEVGENLENILSIAKNHWENGSKKVVGICEVGEAMGKKVI